MIFWPRLLLPVIVATLMGADLAIASSSGSAKPETLTVAVREAPPFAFRGADGRWVGVTVEAWEYVARQLGYTYEYREYDLVDALDAVRKGEVDVGVGAFSITAQRAAEMYFTHSYASAELGIATTQTHEPLWGAFFGHLFSWGSLRTLLIVVGIVGFIGCCVWLFERKSNPEHFSDRALDGLTSGFWWSAVTMTTVGYGDKAPVTLGGRVVGLLWMVISLIIISGFTGSIAAVLTMVQMKPKVTGPQDLHRTTVGTLAESAADEYLESQGIHPRYYEKVRDGLQAVESNEVEAFVFDHPILSYWVARSFAGRVDVLPQSFHPSYLALPLPTGSSRHREIDLALLRFVETPAWNALLAKYNVIQ